MSADQRTVTTDALETLGTIHTKQENRDAIHLGVEPIEAGEPLRAGEHVCMKDGKAFTTVEGKRVGIVDPFLERTVETGQRFWLVVYPRQIASLRHVWEHPDFPASKETWHQPTPEQLTEIRRMIDPELVHAEGVIKETAERIGVTTEWLLEAVDEAQGEEWPSIYHPESSGGFDGHSLDEDFYKAFATVRHKRRDQVTNVSLSCAC